MEIFITQDLEQSALGDPALSSTGLGQMISRHVFQFQLFYDFVTL